MLTRARRAVLLATAVIAAVIVLYPPCPRAVRSESIAGSSAWMEEMEMEVKVEWEIIRPFLLHIPSRDIDFSRLLLELVALTLLAGAVFFLLPGPHSDRNRTGKGS